MVHEISASGATGSMQLGAPHVAQLMGCQPGADFALFVIVVVVVVFHGALSEQPQTSTSV